MSTIWVEITATRGSAPRDAGTAMAVTDRATQGTIGGGALELSAIETARRMLRDNLTEATRQVPLGPGLGQCCGGSVTLHFGRQPRAVDAPRPVAHGRAEGPRRPMWVWGAGHVGRAFVTQAAATGLFELTWIDSTPDRFAPGAPKGVTVLPAADMPRAVTHAPTDASHLIVTYSHDIDLKLCAGLLRHGFAFCGLIGSETKRARFASRLRAMGLDPSRITCPIGDKSLGKHPDMIAAGTIRALTRQKEQV